MAQCGPPIYTFSDGMDSELADGRGGPVFRFGEWSSLDFRVLWERGDN